MSKKNKILYVDDEPVNLQLFEINMHKNYEVITAESGFKGLELLDKNTDVPIIISDMKMPQMNGIEFIKKAKAKYPDKKFCILTGFDITDEIQEALKTGLIIKYFRKPFSMREMDKILLEAIDYD